MATALSRQLWGLGLLKRQQVDRFSPQRQRRFFLSIFLLGLCLVGLALLHVWLRLQVVHLGYVLSTTSKLHNQLEQENRELKVELATLTSPDRLEAMARTRLGLVEPEKGQVVFLP
ncbi:MAG: cell division protein FtsL [Candidatus Binatota bacterium]